MKHEYSTTLLEPVCPDCGERVPAPAAPGDWTNAREARLAANAFAVQLHRATAHPLTPKVGDIVVYHAAWRDQILGTGPLEVRSISEYDLHEFARSMGQTHLPVEMGVKYYLVNPSRESDYYLPSTGDLGRPITFEIITEYTPPLVEATLFDLLGGDWVTEGDDDA